MEHKIIVIGHGLPSSEVLKDAGTTTDVVKHGEVTEPESFRKNRFIIIDRELPEFTHKSKYHK